MKLIILLTLVTSITASFCINGEYNYEYGYDNVINISNNKLLSTVKAITYRGFNVLSIDQLKVGDYIESFDGQYTQIVDITEKVINPRIFASSHSDNGAFCNDGITYVSINLLYNDYNYYSVFTDNIPIVANYTNVNNYVTTKNCMNQKSINEFGNITLMNIDHTKYTTMESIITVSSNCSCNSTYPDGYCHDYNLYNCINMYRYCDGSSSYYLSDMIEFINDNRITDICGYIDFKARIPKCNAIDIRTANGYITVNGILFDLTI